MPYKPWKPRVEAAPNGDNTKSSAKSLKTQQCLNLTLHDWIVVFAYTDAHPGQSQDAIVEHFKTHHKGALIFNQSTLSQRL